MFYLTQHSLIKSSYPCLSQSYHLLHRICCILHHRCQEACRFLCWFHCRGSIGFGCCYWWFGPLDPFSPQAIVSLFSSVLSSRHPRHQTKYHQRYPFVANRMQHIHLKTKIGTSCLLMAGYHSQLLGHSNHHLVQFHQTVACVARW